jgi:Asparagine synthase
VADESLYVMTSMEVVRGYVFGNVGALPAPTGAKLGPREALEQVVRAALLRPPCGVAFSGGRDSSLVLAVATHVARRDGLPEPVPITEVFPDVTDAEEHAWQELVVRHLGLREWQKVTIREELDLVGPLARAHLIEHGILWPPTIAVDVPLLEFVGGGSLIDGEGGDEVLGDATHRVAPLMQVLRSPRPLRRRRVRAALTAIAPPRMRAQRAVRFWGVESTPWLRPPGRQALLDELYRVERTRPMTFAASVRMIPRERHHVLADRNRRILARKRGVMVSSPLLHPDVVHALARAGGMAGPGDRTAVLRGLVPDLLPDEVLARSTKAVFTNCYMTDPTRAFAAEWDGEGVDVDLVDADELRRCWLGEHQHALTAALLQQAWLASTPRIVESGRDQVANRADS